MIIQGSEEKLKGIHYEVDVTAKPLGVGGMGQVYRGTMVDERTGVRKPVAIKFLFDDLPDKVVDRARREASIQIHNDNLVEMFGFIQIDEPVQGGFVHHYHVVSELLNGVCLNDLLKGKLTNNEDEVVEYAVQLYDMYNNDRRKFTLTLIKSILTGIMAMHDSGYIHRDLDPSNVMITSDGKIKVIDFGIAKQMQTLNTQDQHLTSAGQFMGKAAYASPELVVGDVNHQNETTDIYAIGIMMFQFIAGSLPFDGPTHEVLDMQLTKPLPLKLIKDASIRRVIAKATAKKQNERYNSCAAFRVAIEELISKGPESASSLTDNAVVAKIQDFIGKMPKKVRYAVYGGVAAVVALGIAIPPIISAMEKAKMEAEILAAQEAEELISKQKEQFIAMMKDSVMDDISPVPIEVTDSVTGISVRVRTVGMTMNEAIANLHIPEKAALGVDSLRELADKDCKVSIEAQYMLARLAHRQNDRNREFQEIKERVKDLVADITPNVHQMMENIVAKDSTHVRALYMLGCDEVRKTKDEGRDIEKAIGFFKRALEYAKEQNNEEYINACEQMLKQLN